MTPPAPQTLCIAGGGTAGWMAAAALARFAPPGLAVTLVESEAIGTIGVGEATIPQIRTFNAGLGLDEKTFIAATQATIKLGIEFAGWGAPEAAYMHAFGLVGAGHGAAAFHHLWLRGQNAGVSQPPGAYALNEHAARAGRFATGPGAPDLPYAYHLDAALFAAHLRRYAEARGVTRIEGRIAAVETGEDADSVTALRLDDGRRVAADFFIDCTGFAALLIGGALNSEWTDWSHWLRCDRAIAVPSGREAGDPLPPFTTATAHRAGWRWRIPLQHRTGNGIVYDSARMSDDEAQALLLGALDRPALADPRPIAFRTGMRGDAWRGNCLALGLAAGFMEPLESTSIHLVQSALSRFLGAFPQRRVDPAVRAWFNAAQRAEWEGVRDFLILHYAANGRHGEPFWDDLRAMDLPPTLAERLARWRGAGHLHREGEELFHPVGWFQVLAGQGVAAEAWSPLADALPDAALAGHLAAIAERHRAVAARLPHHAEVIASLAVAPPPPATRVTP